MQPTGRRQPAHGGESMSTTLRVFANGADALLVGTVDETIADCRGFAIRRVLTRAGKAKASWLPNRSGFKGQAHTDGEQRPSTQWPFQGFSWTDHEIGEGDTARYRVVPVVRLSNGK